MEDKGFLELAAQTRDIYETEGRFFDAFRPRILFERKWLERFAALMPTGGKVLDLGCGAGEPIAAYFLEQGFNLTGIDFARTMLDLARKRFPEARWIEGDMCNLDLAERFDGIIGWDSFFHLKRDQQRALLPVLAHHLNSDGALMLTVGPEDGEVNGQVGNRKVYHASLSPQDYAAILADAGMKVVEFIPEDPECDGHTVLLANKSM